jgi:hypothetical protein
LLIYLGCVWVFLFSKPCLFVWYLDEKAWKWKTFNYYVKEMKIFFVL